MIFTGTQLDHFGKMLAMCRYRFSRLCKMCPTTRRKQRCVDRSSLESVMRLEVAPQLWKMSSYQTTGLLTQHLFQKEARFSQMFCDALWIRVSCKIVIGKMSVTNAVGSYFF